jgi:hypothetical protein
MMRDSKFSMTLTGGEMKLRAFSSAVVEALLTQASIH